MPTTGGKRRSADRFNTASLDTPDHNNVSGWMLARERDCDPQEFGIVLAEGEKNGS
jgi:hypothetical protein